MKFQRGALHDSGKIMVFNMFSLCVEKSSVSFPPKPEYALI